MLNSNLSATPTVRYCYLHLSACDYASTCICLHAVLTLCHYRYYNKHFNTVVLFFSTKVRSVWTSIVEMLTSLKKEKEVVDSVLEDCVNPCILDGTDVFLSVPQLLTDRIESNKRGVSGFCPSC